MEWGATQLVTKKIEISEFTYGPFVVWLWQLSMAVTTSLVCPRWVEIPLAEWKFHSGVEISQRNFHSIFHSEWNFPLVVEIPLRVDFHTKCSWLCIYFISIYEYFVYTWVEFHSARTLFWMEFPLMSNSTQRVEIPLLRGHTIDIFSPQLIDIG